YPGCEGGNLRAPGALRGARRGASSAFHGGPAITVWTSQEHTRVALQGVRQSAHRLERLAQRHEARLELFARIGHAGRRLPDGCGLVADRRGRVTELRLVQRPRDTLR